MSASFLRLLPTLLMWSVLAGCATSGENVNSGIWHYNAGLWDQAIPRLLSGVPTLEAESPSDARLPTAYVALGDMAAARQAPEKAEEFYNKALLASRTYHARDEVLLRNSLVHAGNFLLDQKRYQEAVPLLAEAAATSRRNASIPILAAADLDNLSRALAGAGRNAEADAARQHSLSILDSLPPAREVHATRGVVLYNLAYLQAEQNRPVEADENYKRALSLLTANGSPNQINIALRNYAVFLRSLGRLDEASQLESQVRR
jgi:tetratricopeptide (TPR) repeat protein